MRASASSIPRIVSGARTPNRCSKRLRATARTPRQTATLSASTPSVGEMGGRNGDPVRELDTGTTIRSSSSRPVSISSTETTTAGRCLPGSPARAAPRATSHSSPRRGSDKAVTDGAVPVAILVTHSGDVHVGAGGIAFGAEERLVLGTRGQFCEQGSQGDPSFPGLVREAVTSADRNPDCGRGCRHISSLLCHFSDYGRTGLLGLRPRPNAPPAPARRRRLCRWAWVLASRVSYPRMSASPTRVSNRRSAT